LFPLLTTYLVSRFASLLCFGKHKGVVATIDIDKYMVIIKGNQLE
jgi:hypothetical protein